MKTEKECEECIKKDEEVMDIFIDGEKQGQIKALTKLKEKIIEECGNNINLVLNEIEKELKELNE